jgi:sec-independent protein translocase protein TatC
MDKDLTFIGHLEELRKRIIVSLIWIGAATMASMPFAPQLLTFLKKPASGAIEKLAFFGPQDAFIIYMRIGFMAGFALSFPAVAYQLWKFISPALDDRFKKNTISFVLSCSIAFILGSLFAFLVLLPAALKFLLSFGSADLEPVISASQYISFVTSMILACGLVFEMPVLSFILTRMGVINAKMLWSKLNIAVVVIVIAAAVITPTTDVFNMMVLAVPMLGLYIVSIWVSAITKTRP